MRVQFHLVKLRVDEYLLYKKAELVARRRRCSVDLVLKGLCLDNVCDLDAELSFWKDKSDEELRREIDLELSKVG